MKSFPPKNSKPKASSETIWANCESSDFIRAICSALKVYVGQSTNAVLLGRSLAQTGTIQWRIGYDIKLRATECFGILHPKVQPLHDRALLRWFLVNFQKSKFSPKKIWEILTDENFWKSIVDNMLLSPGLATEVFLLYALRERQSIKRKWWWKNLSRHFQVPAIFDERDKIDLVSQLFSDDHTERHNVGVQVTTTLHESRVLREKERIFSEIEREPSNKSDRFTPQSGCFLIINDAIGRVNSSQHLYEFGIKRNPKDGEKPKKTTPYSKAFWAWGSKGYESEWPIKHLSRNLHDNYRIVAEIYEHAMEIYRKSLFLWTIRLNEMIVEFPIGKVLYKCQYNRKTKTYKLSYYKIVLNRNRREQTEWEKTSDFLASFTFYR